MLRGLFKFFHRVKGSIKPQIEKIGPLTRQRIDDYNMHSWLVKQYCYWCSCGAELTDGPTGGCAVNAVCEKCRINYGCLQGYFPH